VQSCTPTTIIEAKKCILGERMDNLNYEIMTKIYLFLVVEKDLLKCKKGNNQTPPRKVISNQ